MLAKFPLPVSCKFNFCSSLVKFHQAVCWEVCLRSATALLVLTVPVYETGLKLAACRFAQTSFGRKLVLFSLFVCETVLPENIR